MSHALIISDTVLGQGALNPLTYTQNKDKGVTKHMLKYTGAPFAHTIPFGENLGFSGHHETRPGATRGWSLKHSFKGTFGILARFT